MESSSHHPAAPASIARMITAAIERRITDSPTWTVTSFARAIGVPRSTLEAQLRRGDLPISTYSRAMQALGLAASDVASLMRREAIEVAS